MFISKTGRTIRLAITAAMAVAGMGWTQGTQEEITATIPIIVNVDATVTITPPKDLADAVGITADVEAGVDTALTIILGLEDNGGGTSASHRVQTRAAAPVSTNYRRGNVSLSLSLQQYNNAEIGLFSMNGRRVMSGRVDVSNSGFKMSRANVAAGVYLLSVKGAQGNSYSGRINHLGGRLNIDVAFGFENAAASSIMTRANAEPEYGEWTISASAEGYHDKSYTITPVPGGNPLETITLIPTHFNPDIDYGELTDERDGNKYLTVVMPDGKTWMAENLNYDTLNTTGSWCYDGDDANCAKYGRLYTWAAAMGLDASYNTTSWEGDDTDHQGICPAGGWRLPSDAEWTALVNAVAEELNVSTSVVGTKFKSQIGWYDEDAYYIPGTNDLGFSALPGGLRWDGYFRDAGYYGYWWNATEYDANRAFYRYMYYHREHVGPDWGSKGGGFSVRCVRND